MENSSSHENITPVIKGVSYILSHVPSLIRHGSKPSREIQKDPALLKKILSRLWTFDDAVAYPPNQVFIGNMDPNDLEKVPSPWHQNPLQTPSRRGPFGEIISELEFYGLMKICDEFDLFLLEQDFLKEIISRLENHPLFDQNDLKKLESGVSLKEIEGKLNEGYAIPIHINGDRLVGCIQRGHEEDVNLTPDILLENLTSRASGVLALRQLINQCGEPNDVEYLLGCGEEAVGDRYNRGGGNMAKAIGELSECKKATGSDVKAFCCAPVHAIVLGAGLVASQIYKNVVVVAGGSLPKLGMKYQGHLRNDMPILEDVLASIAIWIGQDDGKGPVIRLDSIGKHEIDSGSSQQAIVENLVVRPLNRLGLKMTEVDKYATEMHNPEATVPQGSGDVPRTNYNIIGSFAVLRKEIQRDDLKNFVRSHGMPGFSPTQGHIASAVPVLGHAVRKIMDGQWDRTLFMAKGSLFLGRMTHLSDGISFLLEKNSGSS